MHVKEETGDPPAAGEVCPQSSVAGSKENELSPPSEARDTRGKTSLDPSDPFSEHTVDIF